MPCALIGAVALAVRGVPRATADADLLVRNREVLEPNFWEPLRQVAPEQAIAIGDGDDPFDGVVRLANGTDEAVDIVVPRSGWIDAVLARATVESVGEIAMPVVISSDLVLLKVFAGGHRDQADIYQLLEGDEKEQLVASVDDRICELDEPSQALWSRIKASLP
ncbi:MAG: hypothetical protein IPK60_09600 [Sandaracinaceae bacterium]|nr:hypothetical protein [Sandaracinaceae bacterium]